MLCYLFVIKISLILVSIVKLVLKHALNLSVSYTTLILDTKQTCIQPEWYFVCWTLLNILLETCAGNIKALNKLYNSTKHIFVITCKLK